MCAQGQAGRKRMYNLPKTPITKDPESVPQDLSAQELIRKLGINACEYEPVSPSLGVAGAASSVRGSLVAGHGQFTASSAVIAEAFASEGTLQELAEFLRDGGQSRSHLNALLDAAREQGQAMLPLIRFLEEKSRRDPSFSALAESLRRASGLPDSAVGAELPQDLAPALAPREREVMERVAKGESNKEIAEALGLRVITVGKCLSRVYRKLGAKNRGEAVRKWLAPGPDGRA
ncbi:LuxR C-terminal-related transcriptional regulator [Desulfovibrio sp. OttesenSCG-928-C14]|nr:LuxR C-terminal-related transcriptional regulator [Desulfovibrio sp. OttesenSCG-928-C14]